MEENKRHYVVNISEFEPSAADRCWPGLYLALQD